MLAACNFNLCFMFVLPSSTRNIHDNRIQARAVYSPNIHFPQPALRKYYYVDSRFAYRLGYIAPYKGSYVHYHFQEFHYNSGGKIQLPSLILS